MSHETGNGSDTQGPFPVSPARVSLQAALLAATAVTAVWVVLYLFNTWLFAAFAKSASISWIFLPAAVRMLSVMLLGWPGVLGLFAGSMIVCQWVLGLETGDSVARSALSAIGPMLAYLCCRRWLGIADDLRGLRGRQLLVFAFAGAIFNSLPNNLYFYWIGLAETPFEGVVPMFVGDMVGTLLTLYGAAALLRLLSRAQRKPI